MGEGALDLDFYEGSNPKEAGDRLKFHNRYCTYGRQQEAVTTRAKLRKEVRHRPTDCELL